MPTTIFWSRGPSTTIMPHSVLVPPFVRFHEVCPPPRAPPLWVYILHAAPCLFLCGNAQVYFAHSQYHDAGCRRLSTFSKKKRKNKRQCVAYSFYSKYFYCKIDADDYVKNMNRNKVWKFEFYEGNLSDLPLVNKIKVISGLKPGCIWAGNEIKTLCLKEQIFLHN